MNEQTPIQPHTLKACPLCKMNPPANLSDTLYPSGIYWRETDGLRHYVGHNERSETDQACWTVTCGQNSGGCGASVGGDSAQEAVDLWNRRDVDQSDELTKLKGEAKVLRDLLDEALKLVIETIDDDSIDAKSHLLPLRDQICAALRGAA